MAGPGPTPTQAGPATLPGTGAPEYRVMRQDDNGDRSPVAGALAGTEAERLVTEFEARGHKQLYRVEREPAPGSGVR